MNSSLRLNRCWSLKPKFHKGCIQSNKGKVKMNFRSFKAMDVFRKTTTWKMKRIIHNKDAMPTMIQSCMRMPDAMHARMQARNRSLEQVSNPIK